MEIVKFIGLLAFTYLFIESGPIRQLKIYFNVGGDSTPKDLTRQIIRELINCAMCSGFYIGFFYYLVVGAESVVLMACLVSVASEFFYRIVNYLFKHTPLNKM